MQEQDQLDGIDKITIDFNSPEIDLDNLDNIEFKPLTQGLGFHKEEKNKKILVKPKIPSQLRSDIEKRKNLESTSELIKQSKHNISSIQKSSLENFYAENRKRLAAEEKIIPKRRKLYSAGFLSKFSAWILDLSIVLFFLAITGGSLMIVSGLNPEIALEIISVKELTTFLVAIFSIYYLVYFTVLDLSSTPGKFLLNIRVVSRNKYPLMMRQTFLRSFITLCSLFLFGIPILLQMQETFSRSRVVKNND